MADRYGAGLRPAGVRLRLRLYRTPSLVKSQIALATRERVVGVR